MTKDTPGKEIASSDDPGAPPTRAPAPSATDSSTNSAGSHPVLTGCLMLALLILTGQWWWLSSRTPEPLPWQHSDEFARFFEVDINSATWVEWIQLKGIGQVLAHRIVADREVNGPFSSIEDLQRVDGIGPATLDQIRPWLTISHDISTEFNSTDVNHPIEQSSSL